MYCDRERSSGTACCEAHMHDRNRELIKCSTKN